MLKVFASVKDVDSTHGNTGDFFSFFLVNEILKKCSSYSNFQKLGVNDKSKIDANTFFFVGSILNQVPKYRGAVIYGPGLISYDDSADVTGNVLHGVRGFLTQEKISKNSLSPRVVSDPGLLLPKIFPVNKKESKKNKIGFVVHSVDRKVFFNKFPSFKDNLIDNYNGFESYIDQLMSCEVVVTSSLHGAVFCHSLGIRVAVISVSGNVTGGDFKFRDYYSSLGIDFKFMNYDHLCTLDDFYKETNNYPQPSSFVINAYQEMQYRDIHFLLNNSY